MIYTDKEGLIEYYIEGDVQVALFHTEHGNIAYTCDNLNVQYQDLYTSDIQKARSNLAFSLKKQLKVLTKDFKTILGDISEQWCNDRNKNE